MKEKLLLVSLLFFSTTSFAKKIYSMTKEDFASQFNESHFLQTVYCENENGNKVWLHCNKNTILKLTLKDDKTEELMLGTIKLIQGKIEAVKYNVWIGTKKISVFDFNEVAAISIQRKFQEYERPYFNVDSSRNIVKQKNDSLRNIYSEGMEYVVYLIKAKNSKNDSIRIAENACYHLTFNDGVKTQFGVVEKITKDSIRISNFLGNQMASANKKNFEILNYPIESIKEISLLKPGGYSYNNIEFDGAYLIVVNESRKVNKLPYWFAVDPTTGAINFYRLWQTDHGFPGIMEKDGKAIWYEGEKTE